MTSLTNNLRAIETWEPSVKALVGWDPTAALSRARAAAHAGGPLAGWTVAVKDIIDVAGVPTLCNAPFMPNDPAPRHAPVVAALLDAGAVWLAKTVTTTFAYLDPGPTRNPWNPRHTPGGSSSGSAAAVAAGMVRLALGSQTAASVNRPASFCGIVGVKPTFGTLPTDGVFPFAPTVDTVGLLTSCVDDAQTALHALTNSSQSPPPDRLRIGVCTQMHCDRADPPMVEAIGRCARLLESAGHEVLQLQMPSTDATAHHMDLISAEAAHSHRNLFDHHRAQYTPKLRALIEAGTRIDADRLARIESHRGRTIEQVETLFDHVDVVLTPSAPGAAPAGIESTGDPRMSLIWTYTGCPTVTVPMQLSAEGLPLGAQLSARRGNDGPLLAAARLVEQAIDFREKPSPPSR